MCGKTISIILQGREGKGKTTYVQETSQQLLNKDGTIKNWEEGIDQRIIRESYELFIHGDFPDADYGEELEDTLIQIHGGGFKRRIITDQTEWGNIILRSKCHRGWVEAEDYNSEEEELNNNWEAICRAAYNRFWPHWSR